MFYFFLIKLPPPFSYRTLPAANKDSEYSAPDGTNFVLSKRHSAELKVAVQAAHNKQDANRHRSFTSPGLNFQTVKFKYQISLMVVWGGGGGNV